MLQLPLLYLIPSSASVEPEEACANLEEIFRRLNQCYFQGIVGAKILWGRYGRRPRRVRRRTIRLGSYFFESQTIRIHPVLAQAWVPRQVLESVIYHEMCHAAAPSKQDRKKRRCHHHEEFRKIERRFEHHDWVERWIKENIDRLLRTRGGT